jgi:DNA helicase-2/ATP-dependent DNA helicase PcrA
LRSVHRPEALLFPREEDDMAEALPAGVATEEDVARLERLAAFLRDKFDLRALPVDDLTLALADTLFATGDDGDRGQGLGARGQGSGTTATTELLNTDPLNTEHSPPATRPSPPAPPDNRELDLAIAYQIAAQLRQWREAQPEWRLPELVAQLQMVASGRRTLSIMRGGELGYEPTPGRISLATQHSSKGLEWDAVFLVGIDGMWIPGSLEAPFLGVHDFLGGDPNAEATAQLRYLMGTADRRLPTADDGRADSRPPTTDDEPVAPEVVDRSRSDIGLYPNRTATESAHIEVICERLRLLYVGITRARRFLQISRSRATRRQSRDSEAEPATVLGVLYRYLQGE